MWIARRVKQSALQEGRGPRRLVLAKKKVLITEEAAQEWVRAMEAEAA